MVKIVSCCQEIRPSLCNLMVKQSFVTLSRTLSGIQWGRSQVIGHLSSIYKKVDATNRMLFIHLRFIVLSIIIPMLGFGDIARSITDLYPILMCLHSRIFLL